MTHLVLIILVFAGAYWILNSTGGWDAALEALKSNAAWETIKEFFIGIFQ